MTTTDGDGRKKHSSVPHVNTTLYHVYPCLSCFTFPQTNLRDVIDALFFSLLLQMQNKTKQNKNDALKSLM